MKIISRKEKFKELFPNAPAFRLKQIEQALFNPSIWSWEEVSTLDKPMREILSSQVPWMSVIHNKVYTSKNQDTFKAVLSSIDDKQFETVLMANKKGQWTICVSSQIGCAMKCVFCATGTMGLKRSLLADEIVDQYRFWKKFLLAKPNLPQRISNVVFMGMGEPMANYENVKEAINIWLKYTDIGPTKITVSSVGILSQLEKILVDKDWPRVRIAISLHSANQTKREEIVPTTIPDFLKKLADWSQRYAKTLGTQKHHITYEYILINEVNDTPQFAHELGKYISKTGSSKINVIPYNPVEKKSFKRSVQNRIDDFKEILLSYNIDVTQRKTMGDDISSACGQLVTEKKA